ncbi:hypothetical protein [Saccharopolyspora gloriosae]|uniref:hypothetical protein n=1 Tax=Saccharopolyspora gloriosae TaxID=455344 RepID=UPI001FB58841|nr:hypothetical protein [Saccharopolyspora gloriosae]
MDSDVVEIFPFRFSRAHRLLGLPFGITPPTTWVRVSNSEFTVRFGPWCLRTERSNITGTSVTGPYWLLTTAGPARLSVTDGGLTCATNADRGLCVRFAEPMPGIDWLGLVRHPAVTVTVADCDRLAALLAPSNRPSDDTRSE